MRVARFVTIVLLLALSGCGSDEGTDVVTTTVTAVETATEPPKATKPKPPAPDQPIDAAQAVTRFYKLVGSFRFASAWDLYPASARDEAGSLDHWREGYRTTIETVPHNVTVLASSTDAVQVGVDIESKDRDLCGGPPITQTFSGSWSFVRSGRDLVPQGLAIEKTGGVAPTTNRSDCPGDGGRSFKELGGGGGYGGGSGGGGGYSPPSYTPPPANEYDTPQYTPGGDGTIDCGQIGATNIPVTPGDPNGLDADGDGIGCES